MDRVRSTDARILVVASQRWIMDGNLPGISRTRIDAVFVTLAMIRSMLKSREDLTIPRVGSLS